ncbi:ras association domain-containing protein 6 [Denticeps clupeoides]|uniref:Ras association domain-containing protein 6 n=1 Tax=Denticeps clupeoides TaxID=299321 RepID=A0AAY4AHT8_9TELE|nr:ras association domain-containing protein 6 [Denticeps clupeoides]XP_028829492.1 ras association domain-containing protein 6 [Denticeps clupeoides]XP_028829493.1 ras association domain-containing protein 6 [Denticeps clupeoides]
MVREMDSGRLPSVVHIGGGRCFPRAEFLSLLNTYNCFLKDKAHLHLTFSEETGQVTVEGILVISWGVKRPIRLKIQDEKQILPCENPKQLPDPVSPFGGKRGMTRWGELDNLHDIDELEENPQSSSEEQMYLTTNLTEFENSILRAHRPKAILEESSILFRTRSDASLVKKRVKDKTAEERQQARQHRFSINGHFYNYKTSIFTPSYGTTTNVHITSRMTTHEVIEQLLQKFKIENDPNEFALYSIHQSGERRKLGDSDHPLLERILHGPSESIMSVFLMDTDEQEVSTDVAQYLSLELPILERVLWKLHEDEAEEIQKVITKYRQQHKLLSSCLNSKLNQRTETTV